MDSAEGPQRDDDARTSVPGGSAPPWARVVGFVRILQDLAGSAASVVVARFRGSRGSSVQLQVAEHDLDVVSLPASSREALNGFVDALRDAGLERAMLLVAGPASTGKSSLVNQIVNERVVAASTGPKLALPPGAALRNVLQPVVDTVARLLRVLLPGPLRQMLRVRTPAEHRVSVIARRVGGLLLDIVDIPGLPSDGTFGALRDAREIVAQRGGVVNVLMYVTRLDDTRADRSDEQCVDAISSMFGHQIWRQVVVALTHASSLPPSDLGRDAFLRGRRDAVWEAIANVVPFDVQIHSKRRGEGPNDLSYTKMNAPEIALVESSPFCPQNKAGEKLLPDGHAWLPEMYHVLRNLITETAQEQVEGEDELAEEDDPRLIEWRQKEETLFIDMDTWYMEHEPGPGDPVGGTLVRAGYRIAPFREPSRGYIPLAACGAVAAALYFLLDMDDARRKQRDAEAKARYESGVDRAQGSESFIVGVHGSRRVQRAPGEVNVGPEITEIGGGNAPSSQESAGDGTTPQAPLALPWYGTESPTPPDE